MIVVTKQDRINAEVQMKLALQDAKFNVFMQEMRDRDNQRAEDIREIRASLQNMQASNRSLNIVTILGIAALVIAVSLK